MTAATCVVALLVALTGAAWLVVRSSGWTWTAYWLSLALIALVVPSFRVDLPFDARGVALLASAGALASLGVDATGRARLRHVLTDLARPRTWVESLWCGTLVALVAWICVGAIWTPAALTYVAAQFAFAVGLALCVIVVLDRAELLRQALVVMSSFVVLATLLELVVDRPDVRYGASLRGPFLDANTLGLVVAFALPAVIVTVPRAKWLVAVIGVALVWETGSRTALLALIATAVLAAWHERQVARRHAAQVWRRTAGRILVTVVLVGLAAVALFALDRALATGANDASILRSNNSRTDVWQASQKLVDQHPWRGLGIGAYDSSFQTGSSYYASMILIGVVGTFLIVVLLVLSTILAHARMDWLGLTLAAALVTSVFEGWILAPGGAFCVIFWAGLFAWVQRQGSVPEPASPPRPELAERRLGHSG